MLALERGTSSRFVGCNTEFDPGVDEHTALNAIVSEGVGRGLRFYSDEDARPAGAAQAAASLWDNGTDPVAELLHVLRVRKIALSKFGERNVPTQRPSAELEEVLAPLYFHHRYQLAAAAKLLGGIEWRHTLRGEEGAGIEPVSGSEQLRALDSLLATVSTDVLDLPESVLGLLVPRTPESVRHGELFASGAQPAFDALGAAESAARLTFDEIFQAERCARIIDQSRRDSSVLSLEEVFEIVLRRVFPAVPVDSTRELALVQAVQRSAIASLIELARTPTTSSAVRVEAEAALLRASELMDVSASAQSGFLRRAIERFIERDHENFENPIAVPEPPPGSPIGCGTRLPLENRQ